jgi:biopolymer transport protein ExbD
MDYYSKYLKYKKKYLNLKNNNVISSNIKNKYSQIGAGNPIKNNQYISIVRFSKRHNITTNKKPTNLFSSRKEFKNLSKWIEESKTRLLSTKDKNGEFNYNDDKFKLFNYKQINKLLFQVTNILNKDFNNTNKWILNKIPNIDKNNKNTDPVFIQKVNINNKNAKIAIIGDIHSSLHSLIDILDNLNQNNYFSDPGNLRLRNNRYIFFLGDLIDRGAYSLEVIILAFILKHKNPYNVYIINGNHEDYEMYSQDSEHAGTSEEIKKQLPELNRDYLSALFYLPSAIYLNFNGNIYHLSHGAFDYKFSGFNDKGYYQDDKNYLRDFLDSNKEYALINDFGPDNLYKWGDFDQNEINFNPFTNIRVKFGPKIIEEYCTKNGITSLITGHQDLISFGVIVYDDQQELIDNNKDNTILGNTIDGSNVYKYINSEIYANHYNGYLYEIRPIDKKYNDPINGRVHLKTGDDFIACVTSTATIAKNIPQNTYLELYDKY